MATVSAANESYSFRYRFFVAMQGACVASGQFLSEVDVTEDTVSELLRCYILATDNNLEEVSHQDNNAVHISMMYLTHMNTVLEDLLIQ